jgi:hypothetical protein
MTPRRLVAVIIAAAVVLIVVVGSATSGGAPHDRRPAADPNSQPAAATTAPGPAAAPSMTLAAPAPPPQTVAPAAPSPSPALPGPAALAATAFVTAWSSHLPDPGWFTAVRPLVTAELAAGLASTDPSSVPAHRVTGSPVGTGDSGGGQAVVPTDAGPVDLVLVVAPGGVWLVSDVEPGTR